MASTAQLSALLTRLAVGDASAAVDIVGLLGLRVSDELSDRTTVVALTVEGLDVYVSRSRGGEHLAVSVGTDELPEGVSAVVESNDGMSWEQTLTLVPARGLRAVPEP